MLLLVVVVCIGMFAFVEIPVGAWQSTQVAVFTSIGFESVITLVIAVVSSNLFLTGFWLRAFSAKSTADLRKACGFAGLAATPFIVLLGVTGMMGAILHQRYSLGLSCLAASSAHRF